MPLHPLLGHVPLRQRLATTVTRGHLPQVLLLAGPAGVGKQRLALWLGQRLLCERPGTPESCDRCRSCRLALDLAHPDLHWFVPVARPKAGEAERQVDEVAELLAEAMGERRGGSWPAPDGMLGHGLAAMHLLQRRARMRPVEGPRAVFIVGDADRLVTQDSSHEAANALLKLLEEPPAHATLVLTSSDPRRLLPTIRSRAVTLRVAPSAEAPAAVANHDAPERKLAAAVLAGLERGGLPAVELLLRQNPWSARGEFTALLDALGALVLDAARDAARGEGAGWLARHEPAALARALERIADARERAQGNVNPQLLLAVLGEELEAALCA